ncbi:MAG: diiron oxygenase [Pseudomonadota bacterium]
MMNHAKTKGYDRLVTLSEESAGEAPIRWPEHLDDDDLCFAPDLVSLAGTEDYAGMDDAARRRLTLFEAANFFSLNIHGETHVIKGIAARLNEPRFAAHRGYLQHFLEEEVRHSAMFATFCRRYAGKVYAERSLAMSDDHGPDGDLLFFARIAVFEEIVDAFNRTMARDQTLAPVVREIHRRHHVDEARHLAFGRSFLNDIVAARASDWTADERHAVAHKLERFADQSWRLLFNPEVYADAGLGDVFALRRRAIASEASQQRRDWTLRGCRRLLSRLDPVGPAVS